MSDEMLKRFADAIILSFVDEDVLTRNYICAHCLVESITKGVVVSFPHRKDCVVLEAQKVRNNG